MIVAVIDGGYDIAHPDLADNLWINPGELPVAGQTDCSGHPGFDFVGRFGELSDMDGPEFTLADLNHPRDSAELQLAQSDLTTVTGSAGPPGFVLSAAHDGDGSSFSGLDLYESMADNCDGPDEFEIADDLLGASFLRAPDDTIVIDGDPRARIGATSALLPRSETTDAARHGMSIASIIGAVGDNERSMTGVAQRVRLMLINVSADGGRSVPNRGATAGLTYARIMGADIANLSAGGSLSAMSEPDSDLAVVATQYQQALVGGSMLLVTSAGNGATVDVNEGVTVGFDLEAPGSDIIPANLDVEPMLVVAASRSTVDGRTDFSLRQQRWLIR